MKIEKGVNKFANELQNIVNLIAEKTVKELKEESITIERSERILKLEESIRLVLSLIKLEPPNIKCTKEDKKIQEATKIVLKAKNGIKTMNQIEEGIDLMIGVILTGTAIYEGDNDSLEKVIEEVENQL